MIVADVHNHTNASHGKASVGEMYAAAKDRGLAVYGFSEHSPRPEAYSYPVEYREHLRQNFVCYASEVMQLRALSGSPKVLLGMELDWFPSERPFMEAAVAAYPFDYIIGGIHFLGSWGFDFTQDDWKISPQQCYTRYENYFRTLADMARSGLVDIAAHPDIIKLYSVDVFHQWLAMPESLALISEALTAIRDNGLVMEISSAGLRKPCNEIYPHPAIMKLASELGVKISFGSDAHCPNTPAYAYSSTTSKLNGRYSEQSYVTPNTGQLLELVNTKLSPYAEVFTRSDLDMMTVNSDGSVSSSTGHVEDSNATHPRSYWQAQWTPQEPEEETPPEGETGTGTGPDAGAPETGGAAGTPGDGETTDPGGATEPGTGSIDPDTGDLIDPETGGIIDPGTGQILDPGTGQVIGQLPGGSGDPAAGESGGTAPESPDSQPSDGETAPPVDPGTSDGGTAAPDDGFIIVT